MLRNFVRLLLHKCSFVWNVLSQEEYLEKTGCTDVSSQSSFDVSTWYDITRGPSKGRLYGFGSSLSSTSASSVSSTLRASEEKFRELTKVVEEFSKREEENRKLLEIALEEVRKREEEARKREADLQELVRKLIQEVGYTNHQFPGGSGQ